MNRGLGWVSLFGLLAAAAVAEGENWPHWRGPRLDSVCTETGAPVRWSANENIKWRTPLPGPAGATPIVWDDRIFLTSVDGDNLVLLCLGTDGAVRWSRTVGAGNQDVRGDEGNYASPSPVTDGQHVCTFMANGLLACYDLAGNLQWKADLQQRYGKFDIQFGLSSTPVLDGGRLYLQLIQGTWNKEPSNALVIALDKATGGEVWKHARRTDATDECKQAYASPMLYRDATREFLLSHGADYIIAHDLQDGHELWRCGGMNPKGNYNATLRLVASPVAVPGLIIAPTAKNGPVLAIRPSARGDITGSREYLKWVRPQNTPDVSCPLVADGLVYLCRENGNLICLDAETGEQYYEQRTVRDRHRASPLYADGKVFLTARNGTVTVVKAGRQFEMIAQNSLNEPMSASPVIANGTLYLRTFKALYAIGSP